METSVLGTIGLGAIIVAMFVTLYDMGASLRPAACPECRHCRDRAEEEARVQERLTRKYAQRNNIDIDEDDERRIG